MGSHVSSTFCSGWNIESMMLIVVLTVDFLGSPVAKTTLIMQGAWVQSLPGELDPTCPTKSQGNNKNKKITVLTKMW